MHELPVTEGIYKIVMDVVEREQPKRVVSVTIRMGEGCDYVPEIIEEYLSIFAEGTVAEGAKIIAKLVPTTILCRDCDGVFPKDLTMQRCPKCGSERLRPQIWNDLTVEDIQLEM